MLIQKKLSELPMVAVHLMSLPNGHQKMQLKNKSLHGKVLFLTLWPPRQANSGSVELVKSFDKLSKEATENGKQRWAVVTSGTLPLATKWLKLLSIERPDCFITAEK